MRRPQGASKLRAVRSLLILAFLTAGLACGSDEGLISSSHPDYADLELPEEDDECSNANDCQVNCVHGCVSREGRPITCPQEPPPKPAILESVSCSCLASRCQWE